MITVIKNIFIKLSYRFIDKIEKSIDKTEKKESSILKNFDVEDDIYYNGMIRTLLQSIEETKSYYVGGTLCIDGVLSGGDILMLNLDGTYISFCCGDIEGQISVLNLRKLFEVYKKYKGINYYYLENLANSGLRMLLIEKQYKKKI